MVLAIVRKELRETILRLLQFAQRPGVTAPLPRETAHAH